MIEIVKYHLLKEKWAHKFFEKIYAGIQEAGIADPQEIFELMSLVQTGNLEYAGRNAVINYTKLNKIFTMDITPFNKVKVMPVKKIYFLTFSGDHELSFIHEEMSRLGLKPCVDHVDYRMGLEVTRDYPEKFIGKTLISPNEDEWINDEKGKRWLGLHVEKSDHSYTKIVTCYGGFAPNIWVFMAEKK